MANSPIIGMYICPHCKSKLALFWNGNYKQKCWICKREFQVKRQKFRKTEKIKHK